MASATAIKEELPFIKVEHAECDHGIVEISSSTSSGNDTLVESGDGGSRAEGTSPLPTKRRSPDMLTANGIDCAAKRLKADCNGIDLHSSTFLRENPDAGLPDDFLQPLQAIQPNAPLLRQATTATTSSPSLVCPVTDNTNKIFRQFWKAGDYESDKTGQKSTRGGMDHVRVHPKFLHSNATSHKWALGAVAELLDNALDEVVHGATFVKVDMIKNPRNGEPMLLIEDDGGGMNPDCMRQCMSLGYSVKSKMANTIGQYGNGFKTSTMRLGADAIVFSRCPASKGLGPSESVGMLSYTFLRETGQEDIIVPMIDYEIQPFGLRKLIRSNVEDWNRNMETIKRWSPYTTEAELLDHFKGMKKQGTKIIVFNLWEDDQGELELDFLADEKDIQLRGVNRDEKLVNLAESFPSARHYLTYQHSLRSYASILYLRLPPGFKMYLRGKEVEHHNLVDDLMYTEVWTYRPVGSDVQVDTGQMKAVVTVGFVKGAEQHIDVQGFNVYHKNRLIKPFWRLWNSAASRGRGIFGVLEANFVEPAHDKQGFERTVVLARLETRLVEMQKAYWSKHCHKVGYVNNALKGNEGRPAGIKGRSSSINAIPPAASGVPRVPGPKPLPSRSTQTQLSPVGSVSFPPAAKSAQGQSRPILSVSSPLPVMSTEAQVSPLLAGSSPSLTRPTLPLRPTQAHVMSGSHPSPARPTLPPRSTQAQLSPVASFPLAARSAQGQVSPGVSPAWARQMQLSPAASGSLSLLAKSAEVQVPSRSPQAHFPPAVTGSLSLATRSTQLPLSPVVSGSLPLPARSTYMPLSPCVSEPFPLSSRSAQVPLSPALSGSTQLHSSPVVSRSLPLPTTSNQVQFSQVTGSLPCMASSSHGQLSEPSCVSVQAAHGCGSYAPSSRSVPVGHSRSTQVGRLEPQLQPGSRIPPMQPVPSSHPMQPAALSPTQPVSADALPQLVSGSQSHMELSSLAQNWTSRQTDLLSQSQERLQGQYHSATRSALPLPTSSSSGMQSESDRHVVDLGMQLESDRHVIDDASPCLASDQERPAGAGTTENNPRHVMETFSSPSEAAMAVSQDSSLIKTAGRDTLSLQAGAEVSMSPGASRGSVAAEASSSALITQQLPVKEAGLHGSCGVQSGQVSISAEGVTEARSTRETTPPPPRQSSIKASKCSNKSIALERKSLEDLGRIFAKKAAEVSMNCGERIAPESGPDAGAIVCSTSRSIAAPLDTETHVTDLEMEVKPLNTGQITAPERGPDAGAIVCSTSRSVVTPLDMETHVKELEMEVKLLQQRLEAVTIERDNLKRRLFEERLLGQRSKQELEKKVEETWAKVRALEVQNKHLQHVPH